MKVDGKAFKKAREQIRKVYADEQPLYGESAIGTQKWLAEKSVLRTEVREGKKVDVHPTVRTIQNLENKGVASLNVIDAVSIPLKLNGRELIIDYGVSAVTCSAPRYMDFRPFYNLIRQPTEYYKSPFFISIDPIVIDFKSDEIDNVFLESMSLILLLNGKKIYFDWIYVVLLTPGPTWLGIQSNVKAIDFQSPEKFSASIMFNQREVNNLNERLIWKDFIDTVKKIDSNHIEIIVELNFKYFKKELKIIISINEIKNLFEYAEKRYESLYKEYDLKWPRYFQPAALTWDDMS